MKHSPNFPHAIFEFETRERRPKVTLFSLFVAWKRSVEEGDGLRRKGKKFQCVGFHNLMLFDVSPERALNSPGFLRARTTSTLNQIISLINLPSLSSQTSGSYIFTTTNDGSWLHAFFF